MNRDLEPVPTLQEILDEKDKQIDYLQERLKELEKTLWSQMDALTKATLVICDLLKEKRVREGKQGS